MSTQTSDRRLDSVWWALRIGLGLGPFLAGLDKFFKKTDHLRVTVQGERKGTEIQVKSLVLD